MSSPSSRKTKKALTIGGLVTAGLAAIGLVIDPTIVDVIARALLALL